MALNDLVKCFKQLQRNTACILHYFKHGPLLLIVKGIPACAFPKCNHHSLPQLFVHQITSMKLSKFFRTIQLYVYSYIVGR